MSLRDAIGRNDPEFEAALPKLHARMGEHVRAIVALVGTASGALQARRLAAERGLSALVTHDDRDAVAMARTPPVE